MIKNFIKLLIKLLKRPSLIKKIIQEIYYKKFYELKKKTNGMLHPKIYKKLFILGKLYSDSIFVEIGAAHGAATISFANGIKYKKGAGKVYSFERCEGGSRAKYGSKEDNIKILKSNLRSYEVEDFVDLNIGIFNNESYIKLKHKINDSKIKILFIDADGLLHRDFFYLYKHLNQKSIIIIDDYDKNQHHKKKMLTTKLVNQFLKWNLFTKVSQINDLVFLKISYKNSFENFNFDICDKIVKENNLEYENLISNSN